MAARLVDDDPYTAAEQVLAELGRRLNDKSTEPVAARPVAPP